MAVEIVQVSSLNAAYVPSDTPGESVTVKNLSGATVYYGAQGVSSTSNDGSLAAGASVTLTEGKFFVAASTQATLSVDRAATVTPSDAAVTTAKLADASVTLAKLAAAVKPSGSAALTDEA